MNTLSQKSLGLPIENMASNKQFLQNFINFDEQQFDLDEYEKRLQKFEDYLKNRDEKELLESSSVDQEERKSFDYQPNQLQSNNSFNENINQSNQIQPQLHSNLSHGRDQFSELSDIFRSYCDKFKPLDQRPKVHLRKINNMTSKWRQPMYKVNFPNQHTNEKMGSLVSLAKSINYLQKKKQDYELKMQTYHRNNQTLQKELEELTQEFENYEYQTYQELIEEIQSIKQSNEYIQNGAKDPNHYLRIQVEGMEMNARKLKRYERLTDLIKKNNQEQGENEKFYKATCEDLQRLKIREKFLLNQSIDSFGINAGSSQDLQASGIYEYEQRSR